MKITRNSQKSEIEKGTKITHTLVSRISATKSSTKVEKYTVTGHRKAPKGLKIRLLSEYGYGVNDVDFEWKPEEYSPTISSEWEIN